MIPSMTPPEVHSFLFQLGRAWAGYGSALELGSWLGASAAPLARGLDQVGYDQPLWLFDRWKTTKSQVELASKFGQRLSIGQDAVGICERNVKCEYAQVKCVKGELPGSLRQYDGNQIEFCILDAPKRNPVFIDCMNILEPHFIPGITVLGLLDYYSYTKDKGAAAVENPRIAPVEYITGHPEHFEMIMDWPGLCSCAFFKYLHPIQW